MKPITSTPVRNLHEFLADTDGLTKQEVADDLRASGVAVEIFNADVLSIVNTAQRKLASPTIEVPLAEVRTKGRAEIVDLLAQIQRGVFGDDLAEMLAARQQDEGTLGEKDLQALLEATQDRAPDKT